MQKLGIICCNYGKKTDGIGNYSQKMIQAISKISHIRFECFSATSSNSSIARQLLSPGMAHVINKACKSDCDGFIIEYPFMEKSLRIIPALLRLRVHCTTNRIPIIMSLHEYYRANMFRKLMINFIIKYVSDQVLVSDINTFEHVLKLKKKAVLRDIPSNINLPPELSIKEKESGRFIYFGLISKSKAFAEMISAWKLFHMKNPDCSLHVITSSSISDFSGDYGIKILKNLEEGDVIKEFMKAKFAICPILPNITNINATYKTAIGAMCLPIGVFESGETQDIVIDCKTYTIDSLVNSYTKAYLMSEKEYNCRLNGLLKLKRSLPSFEKNASIYIHCLQNS